MIVLEKINESIGKIVTSDFGLILDAHEAFSFFVPNYKFQPKFKSGRWDGKIKLIKTTGEFPIGLALKIQEYFESQDISCNLSSDTRECFHNDVSNEELKTFFDSFQFYSKGKEIYPRPDQLYALFRSIKKKRSVSICPTSFGKSLTIFMKSLYHIQFNRKIIIVVPTVALVEQFESDIRDYCTDSDGNLLDHFPTIHKIYAGQSKIISKDIDICISTWQSIYDLDKDFINQFDVLILDECHKGQGVSIQTVFNNATTVSWKSGWTGTLSDDTIGELVAESIMGPIKEIVETHELMEKGIVADLTVLCVKFRYELELSKKVLGLDYHDEIKYIEKSSARMRKIVSITGTMPKTGLILYRHIPHGESIRNKIIETYKERNVYFIHSGHFELNGKKYKTLDELKKLMECDESGIIIANYQIFSTGISVKNIHWIMFGAPAKAYTTVIQSIGRGLRVSDTKKSVLLIDIIDDFSVKKRTKTHLNYALKHFYERFKYYSDKKFKYKVHSVDIY